jgi:hypothetical protein
MWSYLSKISEQLGFTKSQVVGKARIANLLTPDMLAL